VYDSQPHDAELFEAFHAVNFRGMAWDRFVTRLVAHGLVVIDGLCRSGELFARAERRAWPIHPTAAERHMLATSHVDREELVLEVVMEGFRLFRQKGLVERGWSPEGGATLRTYFIGACLRCVPNAFRRWRKRHTIPEVPLDAPDLVGAVDRAAIHVDSAARVDDHLMLREELNLMPPDIRTAIVRTVLFGETYAAVALDLGVTARALEGRVRRHCERRRHQRGAV
jgi:DNA-directed RNA polymerase specialized sigma24 family protein